ncbi:hypothetical protein FACS1894159_07500 [Bacteroidia bacterium]|nr:hypothetical protein FACS1894159_07500 [Bacteroidia bacterium]
MWVVSPGCAKPPRAKLDNPNATPQAAALYEYLLTQTHDVHGTDKLIAGHWLGGSFRPGKSDYPFTMGEVTEIRRRSGKWIGMIDAWICCGEFGLSPDNDALQECMWYDHMITDYQLWWFNGGICHVDASFYAPMEDGYWKRFEDQGDSVREVNYAAILTPGTGENSHWMALCDRMAEFFLALQERGVPVIFRPFTEAYLDLFWYSNKRMGSQMCIAMWRHLHHYLTDVKGCNNIIWEFQGDHTFPHYPGDGYVDMIATKSEYLASRNHALRCLEPASGMPAGNGELGDFGPNPRVEPERRRTWTSWLDEVKAKCPELSFYITWDRQWGPVPVSKIPGEYPDYHTGYSQMLDDPYVVTRERITVTPRAPRLPYVNDFSAANAPMVVFRGDWDASGSALDRRDADGEAIAFFGATDWSDYSAEAHFVCTGSRATGLAGRCVSAGIFYVALVEGGRLSLFRCHNGHWTPLAEAAANRSANEDFVITLDFRGSNIRASVRGERGEVAAVQASDDVIPAGCLGLFSREGTLKCKKLEAR